jgi:hypothetical protein
MGFGGVGVEPDGRFRGRSCLWSRFARGQKTFVVTGPQESVRQSRVRRRKVRAQLDRPFEVRDSLLQIVVTRAIEKISPLQVRIVRLGIHAARSGHPSLRSGRALNETSCRSTAEVPKFVSLTRVPACDRLPTVC